MTASPLIGIVTGSVPSMGWSDRLTLRIRLFSKVRKTYSCVDGSMALVLSV